MPPLSFTDSQLETVLEVARVVPPKFRNKYLKQVAARLSDDGNANVARAISAVLVKLDGRAGSEKSSAERC